MPRLFFLITVVTIGYKQYDYGNYLNKIMFSINFKWKNTFEKIQYFAFQEKKKKIKIHRYFLPFSS